MRRYVPVGGFWYVCVQLHREPGGGMPEPPLDHPGVLALLDHEAGGDVAEPMEGERCFLTQTRRGIRR